MNESVNSLLDSTLDDLEDLPEFKPFPAGAHKATATLSLKEINDKEVVELALVGIETLELTNPTADEPIKAGDVASTIFMLDNQYGVGNLKKIAKPLAEALGTTTTRECIDAAKDIEVLVLTSIRIDKNDPDKKYLQIKELSVV